MAPQEPLVHSTRTTAQARLTSTKWQHNLLQRILQRQTQHCLCESTCINERLVQVQSPCWVSHCKNAQLLRVKCLATTRQTSALQYMPNSRRLSLRSFALSVIVGVGKHALSDGQADVMMCVLKLLP